MLKEGEKTNKRIARYFYVTVQITSIAHNSMLFFPFQANPFVSVNVVIRSNFVLLCWPFWAFGASLFFFSFSFITFWEMTIEIGAKLHKKYHKNTLIVPHFREPYSPFFFRSVFFIIIISAWFVFSFLFFSFLFTV